jgi:hypothetical protein
MEGGKGWRSYVSYVWEMVERGSRHALGSEFAGAEVAAMEEKEGDEKGIYCFWFSVVRFCSLGSGLQLLRSVELVSMTTLGSCHISGKRG